VLGTVCRTVMSPEQLERYKILTSTTGGERDYGKLKFREALQARLFIVYTDRLVLTQTRGLCQNSVQRDEILRK